jgi:rubrerythrin
MALSDDATRRELLSLALASGLGAGAGALLGPGTTAAVAQTDSALVSALLESEQLAVFSYQHVLHTGLLSPYSRALVHPFLGQERAHVRALDNALLRLGSPLPEQQPTVGDANKLLAAARQTASLSQLRSERDCIMLLIQLEFALEGFYYTALTKLQNARLAGTLAQVMANEAQHACVLSELIRPGNVDKAVPSAFVEG